MVVNTVTIRRAHFVDTPTTDHCNIGKSVQRRMRCRSYLLHRTSPLLEQRQSVLIR